MNSCQFSSRIAGLADGALSQDEINELQRHIGTCSACELELEVIHAVDSLYRDHSLFEPPARYWDELPRRVRAQLEHTQKAGTSQSWVESFVDFLTSWRWQHAAVAVAALVLIFLVSQRQMPRERIAAEPTTVVKVAPVANEDKPATVPERSDPTEQPLRLAKQEVVEAGPGARSDAPPSSQIIEQKTARRTFQIAAPQRIAGRGLKPRSLIFSGPKALVPAPHAGFMASADEPEQADGRRGDDVKIFSQDPTGVSSADLGDPVKGVVFPEIESDFQETLWIVRNSADLGEKRNIWLSFLAREKDPTDHARGTYRLALVLDEIARNSGDPTDAVAAVDFYKDNEENLRRYMHDTVYEKKLSSLVAAAKL